MFKKLLVLMSNPGKYFWNSVESPVRKQTSIFLKMLLQHMDEIRRIREDWRQAELSKSRFADLSSDTM